MAHIQLFDGFDQDAFAQGGEVATATRISFTGSQFEEIDWGQKYDIFISGTQLFFDQNTDQLISGVVNRIDLVSSFGHETVDGMQIPADTIGLVFGQPTPPTLNQAALSGGSDLIEVMGTTAPATDMTYLARGGAGNDTMLGGGSQDTLWGGDGDDVIQVRSGDGNYLRGEAGDDSIVGAAGFDDINGNMGNDTIDGGSGGSDWLVGGQGNDSITAHAGANLILGNLGNDTLHGGNGQDVLRGGQGDDVIVAGSGHAYISGDLGNDTETGGTGPDLFHGSQNIGTDVITNFDNTKGDRVELDPGTTFTTSQVGANTVVNLGGGNEMVLENVQLSSLNSDWIFEGTQSHL